MVSSGMIKTLHRRVLNLLLDRNTLIALIVVLGFTAVASLRFGQTWLEWSRDKYEAVFNAFSDNLLDRSLQGRLCQAVPVDVVITWVNGSDPVFADSLKHAREERDREAKRRKPGATKQVPAGCPYDDCVASHMLVVESVDGVRPFDLADVARQNAHLAAAVEADTRPLQCEDHFQNKSVISFRSVEAAVKAISASSKLVLSSENYELHLAHWTSEWTVPHSFSMPNHCLLSNLPVTTTEQKLKKALMPWLEVTKVWLYHERRLAVVRVDNATEMQSFVSEHQHFELGSGVKVAVAKAHIIVQWMDEAEGAAVDHRRFADYDQLKYTVRSIEKYAPWVRRVFLVTNGQIPHWLNMDHPKLTLVTHKEIFAHRKDLPTFSSSAIESNLDRIEGLSEMFLYFNDDVMLGREVWPDDFYSAREGHKVRLAWPLPDCAPGCRFSWIKDGYCDQTCNSTDCFFDGGDCTGDNIRYGFGSLHDEMNQHPINEVLLRPDCNAGCMDNWLGDSFCDSACNEADCGFDAGDCGTSSFDLLHKIDSVYNASVPNWEVKLPPGVIAAHWNASALYSDGGEVGLMPVDHAAARSVSISHELQLLVVVLHENVTHLAFEVELQVKKANATRTHKILVTGDTSGHDLLHAQHKTSNLESGWESLPKEIEEAVFDPLAPNVTDVDESTANLTEDQRKYLAVLRHQLANQEITQKGFNIKRNHILSGAAQKVPDETVGNENHGARKLLSAVGGLERFAVMPQYESSDSESPVSHSKDLYGSSLLFVNRVYSAEYGYSPRKVPAHMPHFMLRSVFSEMKGRFASQWQATSSHKFRSGDDMQLAFAYYHFIVSEKKPLSAGEIFDLFDTDSSGTWSDREIRTLLARVYDVPLYLETIRAFENTLVNCSRQLHLSDRLAPLYERYYDSQLPLISRTLVTKCAPVASMLEAHFRHEPRHRHHIMSDDDVAFKRLTSNASDVVRRLDDLRRNPAKFVCVNDETDGRADNRLVRAVLLDYLESVLPVPSSFELPAEYRNRYTHIDDVRRSQFVRKATTVAAIICIATIAIVVLASWKQWTFPWLWKSKSDAKTFKV